MSLQADKISKRDEHIVSSKNRETFVLMSSLLVVPVSVLIKLYLRFLSRMLGTTCRFYPTCSTYALQWYQNYGLVSGSVLTIKRLCICHPFHPGGLDEVPLNDINPNCKEAD